MKNQKCVQWSRFIFLLLLFGFLVLSACQGNSEFYIAPDGNDSNSGRKDQPFKTLQRARDVIRQLKCTDQYPVEGITVFLRGGRYELDKPIRFLPIDSGREGAPVVYAAVPGERPYISGGTVIKGWERDNTSGLWKAPAMGIFRQLYVNDRRAIRARFPDKSSDSFKIISWNRDDKTITVPLASVAGIDADLNTEIFIQIEWSQVILRIKDIKRNKNRANISFLNPESLIIFNRRYPPLKEAWYFHIENHRTLLDKPGEWFHDTVTGSLYYKPSENDDIKTAVVIAPRLETLIHIDGTADEPVSHLIFRGLTFEHSNWIRPSHIGLLGLQAGMFNLFASWDNVQIVGRPESAVDVAGAQNIIFERNVFRNLGSTGLDLRWAVQNSRIAGNVFFDIAGTAIRHGTFSPDDMDHHYNFTPEDEREICTNNIISNNYITHIGVDYPDNCGIASGFVRETTIEHNLIQDLPYSGISIGWGWTNDVTVMSHNRIRYNRIVNVMKYLDDGAAVYTLSTQKDSEVAYNYIEGIYNSEGFPKRIGLYFDEGTDYYHRHDNVLVDVTRLYHNNRNGKYNRMDKDFVLKAGEPVPDAAQAIIEKAGLEQAYQDIKSATDLYR